MAEAQAKQSRGGPSALPAFAAAAAALADAAPGSVPVPPVPASLWDLVHEAPSFVMDAVLHQFAGCHTQVRKGCDSEIA